MRHLHFLGLLVVNGKHNRHLDLVAPAGVKTHLLPRLLNINLQDAIMVLAEGHRVDRDDRVLNGDEEVILDCQLW